MKKVLGIVIAISMIAISGCQAKGNTTSGSGSEQQSSASSVSSAVETSEGSSVDSSAVQNDNSGDKFTYVHNPKDNPEAMKDIIENPNAVYGFSPNPDSERLGVYADYDWTDETVVEKGRQERIAYHDSINTMYSMLHQMNYEGKSVEEIARAVSAERNRIRLASCENDPVELEKVKKSNLEKYGDENGPTADSLYEKYGSWEMVMVKAFSTNMGMDACVGLYDAYYQFYIDMGLVKE